jgi:alkylation response protein AidB-like acyl-CoA dehydrogenase
MRDEHLPLLAAGRQLGAFAATEEGAGANLRAIEAVAREDGRGGWRLRGKNIWSSSSSWAGAINVVVRQAGPSGARDGHSAFVVPQGAPGLRFGPEEITMRLRGMVQNSVLLDDVPVGPDQLLGQAGQGLQVAQDTFGFGLQDPGCRACLARGRRPGADARRARLRRQPGSAHGRLYRASGLARSGLDHGRAAGR